MRCSETGRLETAIRDSVFDRWGCGRVGRSTHYLWGRYVFNDVFVDCGHWKRPVETTRCPLRL
jgi:hypothetical protein